MDRPLTLSDVFNPLDAALTVQQLDEMRGRNRLHAMQMQEYQKSQEFKNNLGQMYQSLLGASSQGQSPQGQQGSGPQQPQQPQIQEKLKYFVNQANEFIRTGKNDELQALNAWGYSQPDMEPLLKKSGIISTNTYGPDKYEQVVTLDDESIAMRVQKNPELKDVLYGTDGKPKKGTYRLRYEKHNGKAFATLAEPHKSIEDTEKFDKGRLIARSLNGDEEATRILDEMTRREREANRNKLEDRLLTFDDLNPRQKAQMDRIIDQVKQLKLDPKTAETQAFKTFGVNASGAFLDRFNQRNPDLSIDEMKGNWGWFKSQQGQRLFRRTDSIFEAINETKRLAELVDNPAGTPLNKLTGAAKVAFGNSKRAMLNAGTLFTSDEANQIFGSTGGAVQYFQEISKKIDPNMSVKQFNDLMDETAYFIGTRQKSNVAGTPLAAKWETRLEEISAKRPYLQESNRKKSSLPVGTVQDGYKFKGGDPAKQENWEKQ